MCAIINEKERKWHVLLYLNQLLYKELPYLHKTLQGGTMSTVSRSGCGLCSMSMVVDHLTMESLPIEDCVKMSEECGANRWTGTSIGVLGPVAAEKFGLDYAETSDPEEMLACLHGGGRVIVHIGGDREGHIGVFSHGGHFITLISEENGRIAVEQSNSILSLSANESFGQSVTLSSQIDLPEGYIYDEALLTEKQYVVKMADGSDVPVAFAAYLFDHGHTTQLANAYKTLKGGATPNLNRSCGYDKALFEQKGDFVLKLSVPVSFAKHLIDTGNYDLFCEMVAAAQGVTVEALGLPEIFTYDAPLWARQSAAKATLSIQVPDEASVVPNSFAVYLISSGNADLFYETVNPAANSDTVCFLYDPEQDQTGKITAINGELPTNVTYVESDFTNSGVINVKLDNPTIPLSFAKYIIEKGGFGMFLGTLVDLVALENFHNALFIDAKFPDLLMDEITKMSVHTLAILVVSFVIAILLNQEFKGRAFVRAVFFLPVILSSGVLVNLEAENTLMQGVQDMISEQTPFTVTDTMMDILRLTGLGGDMLQIIFDLIAEVYDIVMASGIQIIIFLSGLQNVPASLYEAADVEGCTKWEAFWKITFPMVSPLLIVNIIYTIIDFFTKMSGDLNTLLKEMQNDLLYAQMSAMMWIYFLVALALIGVSALIVSKVVATDE